MKGNIRNTLLLLSFIWVTMISCNTDEVSPVVDPVIVGPEYSWTFENCEDTVGIDSLFFNTWVLTAKSGELIDTITFKYSILDEGNLPITVNYIGNNQVCGRCGGQGYEAGFELFGYPFKDIMRNGVPKDDWFDFFLQQMSRVDRIRVNGDSLIMNVSNTNNIEITMITYNNYRQRFGDLEASYKSTDCELDSLFTLDTAITEIIKFRDRSSWVVLSIEERKYFKEGLIILPDIQRPVTLTVDNSDSAIYRIYGNESVNVYSGGFKPCHDIVEFSFWSTDAYTGKWGFNYINSIGQPMYITHLTLDSLTLLVPSKNESLYFQSKDLYYQQNGVLVESGDWLYP